MNLNRPHGQRRFLSELINPPIAMSGFVMIALTCLMPQQLVAAEGEQGVPWFQEFWGNLWDPWFMFGMAAQAIFFMRFVVQWIASERRKRSTIPIAFWYLSLVGGLATFIYACHEAQPVFMLGQLLACMIYVRNLMLIYGHAGRVGESGGRPIGELESQFDRVKNGRSSE